MTYTDQEDVVAVPGSDTFAGARFSWEYVDGIGDQTTYSNALVVDQNLDDTDDLRGDMVNSLSVSMNERLALKVSLRWLYDKQPSFVSVLLFDALPPGGALIGSRPVELDELDTIFTASLVINF